MLFYVVVKDLVESMIAGRVNRPVLVDAHTRWYADGPGEEVWVVNFTCFRMEEVSLVEDITAVDPDAHVTLSDITNQPGSPDRDLTVQRVSLRVAPLRLAAVATVPAVTIAVMTTPPNLASSAVPPYQASLLSTRDCTAT